MILHVVQRYPNGAVRAEGWTINGKRNGKWTFFRVDGRKTKEVQYVYGQEHGAAYFDPDYAGKE